MPLAYSGLGASQEAKNDLNKALESYDLAMKTRAAPSFEALNYSNIARIYETKKDSVKAAEFYRKAPGEDDGSAHDIVSEKKTIHFGLMVVEGLRLPQGCRREQICKSIISKKVGGIQHGR